MKHLVFVEHGSSNKRFKSCVKKNVKVKFVEKHEMCEFITEYLNDSNTTWDTINLFFDGEYDKQQMSLSFMGETITTSHLLEEHDINRSKIIDVFNTIQIYTDYIYVYTNLTDGSVSLKKLCIDAFSKTTKQPNDIFVTTNVFSQENTNMNTKWSVVLGFLKQNNDNSEYISHAKKVLFNTMPVKRN
jgi:hypothetical protein